MEDWTEDAGIEAAAADAEAGAADMLAVEAEADTEPVSSAESAQPAVPAAAKASVPERLSRPSAGGGETGAPQAGQSAAPESEIGPAEAAPHWRAFYGAIRDAVQGMRSGDKTE
ncbi:hypothetical protein [Paenibacillus silvisoli]|uniref:hypothetical protein n=1 Tax=Paenibacillus silvisoli TaxID=3110539 RepID=UPI00280490D3|nr:hypothetical protein [Paenibacillus silvisoli]